MKRVTVTVPASSANLGAGFDCLGLALGLYNTVRMEAAESGLELEITGEGAGRLPTNSSNLIVRAAERVFQAVGASPAGLRARADNGIPMGSGLGSSAAATLGGLLAANALVDGGLDYAALLRLACDIEGHPDNAAAALLGGLTMVSATADELLARRVEPAPMRVIIALPDVRLPTAQARAALPGQVPMRDAVFNIGRAVLTVKALEDGDFSLLRSAVSDRLHQPHRRRLIPGHDEVARRAIGAGAAAVALSGAGPSLIAFASEGHETIAAAMAEGFASAGLTARTFVLPVDRVGARVEALED